MAHEEVVLIMCGINSSILENTRAVSRNLSRKSDCGSGSVSSTVDVLIPEVIQVYLPVSILFVIIVFKNQAIIV